jgi:uncharacterized protein (DUF1501 family)
MSAQSDRRAVLKAAAAAGLVPVLSSAVVAERAAAAQDAQPVRGGTFVTLAHDSIEALSPEDTGETVQWAAIVQMFDGL